MSAPRVLLLDDDASIRRFVAMALEELPIALVECETVAEARAALDAGPVRLLITDLTLRDESGFDLLQQLADQPALIGDGRVAVFSAGLGSASLQRLAAHRIWRVLAKPTTVAALEDCVREALAAGPLAAEGQAEAEGAAAEARGHAAQARGAESAPPRGRDAALPDGDEARALQQHFGGDLELFRSYRQTCLTQFALDVASADAAAARRDAAELQRLGHSLKSVLVLLGQPALSAEARALDQAAAAADWPAITGAWVRLRAGLLGLAARG